MRNPRLRSPLLRSLIAFGCALCALGLRIVLDLPPESGVALALYACAALAAGAGVLVLIQSAAIDRIRTLRLDNKRQVDEIVRATFYTEQLGEALKYARERRESEGSVNTVEFAQQMIRSAARRLAVVFDSSGCFYLVETSAQWHVVLAASGTTRFEIEAGKRCPSDRSLDEVLKGIGNHWHVAPVRVGGVEWNLVLLADRPPTHAERTLVDQLALVLRLVEPKVSRTSRSSARLRAV